MAKYYANTKVNVARIFRVLSDSAKNDEGFLSVGEVARRSGLHKWTVSRTVDIWMGPMVEMVIPEELEEVGLKIKLVKLAKPDMTEEQALKCLSVRV